MRRILSLTSAMAILAGSSVAEPLFERQIIFEHEGEAYYHIPVIVTAPDGSIVAFCNERWGSGGDNVQETHLVYRRSMDNGQSWEPMVQLANEAGKAFHVGSAIVDPASGQVIVLYAGRQAVSKDGGQTWDIGKMALKANADGLAGSCHGSAPGIVIRNGEPKGRLVMPARCTIRPYNDSSIPDRQTKCRSCVIYSDDHGATWQTSGACLPGTGEAVLYERTDGTLVLNARAYFNDGQRRVAYSHDGGVTWPEDEWTTFDGTVEINQGTNAGVVRYPPELCEVRDILIFSNPASRGGKEPGEPGSIRQQGTVRLSLDGGVTWPYAKELSKHGDWFDYSSLTVAPDGTILCLYKTTATMTGLGKWSETCSMAVARFNLSWLTDGAIATKAAAARP